MYCIRGTASLLVGSYLSNMGQYVVCDEYNSNVLYLLMSQGSVVGQLLFNISYSQLGMKKVLYFSDTFFLSVW